MLDLSKVFTPENNFLIFLLNLISSFKLKVLKIFIKEYFIYSISTFFKSEFNILITCPVRSISFIAII